MNKQTRNQMPENTPGQRIRKLRLTAGLTQERLSEYLGFTTNYYGQVERDAWGLSKNLASAICSYFNVTYDYLYFGSDPYDIEENHKDVSICHALLIAFIRNCSEEECRLLEPVVKAIVLALRDATRMKHQAPAKNDIPSNQIK